MAEVFGVGVTADQVAAQIAAALPQPASTAPPAVALNSLPGTAGASAGFARADHTHQSRLQARRIQVTPDANGRYVYAFPLPYDTGIVPIISVTAETPTGATYRNDATLLEGSTSNTQTTIIVTRLAMSQTIGVLGAVLTVFQPVTAAVWINIMSRAPS